MLPRYATSFQENDTAIGLLVGSFSLMQFVFAPRRAGGRSRAIGRLVGRAGRRVHWSRYLPAFSAVSCSTLAIAALQVIFPFQLERALGYDRRHSAISLS